MQGPKGEVTLISSANRENEAAGAGSVRPEGQNAALRARWRKTAAGRIAAAALALSCALVIPSGSAQGSSRPRGTPLSFPNPAALARSAFPGGEGPVPHGREAQERTIDLSDVESALDYRTDEPDLPAFLGNEAVALERALAGFLRSSGTALRPDGRLGLMARWARRHLGPGNTLPPQSAFDVLARRLGLAEPIPHLVVVEASGAP
ncbi:MAG TPA: hypothetical protein ENO03_08160, partial [Candidatus Aminicenantes bacterium]|nr:hypothetical protein [Candidatus Aminicenantes bacterium]